MPFYIYKAATREGNVVRNKVEELNKYILLKKLKKAGLMPIKITALNRKVGNAFKKQKRNVEGSNSVLKTVREQENAKSLNTSRASEMWKKTK